MRSLFLALVLMGAPAFADAYDDFSRGIEANNRGNTNAAETHFTAALLQADLAPHYRPSAHLGRARALLHERRCDEAREELSKALTLKPNYIDAYNLRAEAEQCLGRSDLALTDINAAIGLKPAAGYYYTRSRLYWERGDFPEAHKDARNALEADPANPYFVLWQAVSGLRLGIAPDSSLTKTTVAAGWPGPILNLYRGKASIEAVIKAAEADPEELCEANFYVGQWRLAQGERPEARENFIAARNECPRDFVAFEAATAELKRLP